MQPMLNIAVRAARSAGQVILRHMDRLDTLQVSEKHRNDFVTEVDRLAEQAIIRTIHKAYPGHAIQAEESGRSGEDRHLWIIDPLDGTTNFVHGFPHFGVSIALQTDGRLEQAVVYDPVREEIFTASRGAGAQLNNKRLRLDPRRKLARALLGTGFPFRAREHLDTYLATFRALFGEVADIRRAGSAALDLAYVAAGRLDGFWELGLKPWDMAAGALLVREAGGLVTDFAGGSGWSESGNIVAGAPKVCHAILQRIQPLLPDELMT